MTKKKRHPVGPESQQELKALLDRAAASEDERAMILDDLARHRPTELMGFLSDYARERGEEALPVLSQLARSGDDNLAMAAIDAIGFVASDRAVDILRQIESTSIKEARRAARRSLYRLSLAGFRVEPHAQRPWLGTPVLEPHKAYASGLIDGHLRLYWVAFQRPLGGLTTTFVQVDYQLGPTDAFTSDMSSRSFEREIGRIQESEDRYLWAVLPFSYVCHRLLWARQAAIESGKDLPQAFQRVSALLEPHAAPTDTHPVYTLLSQAEVRLVPDFLAESAQLLTGFGEFVWGSHPPVDLEEEVQELSRAKESRVILGPEAQQQRIDSILAKGFTKAFLGERRKEWQLKLEDLAHNLALLGRDRFAKQALAVAVALRDFTETEIRQVPLLKALLPFWLKVSPEHQ
jgi:hypothetical protein